MDGPHNESAQHDHLTGCLLRLFWMILGHALLAFCTISILRGDSSFPSWKDAIYGAVVVGLLAARFVDIQYFQGRTADGEAASMMDWRSYALRVSVAYAGLWLAAHAIGYSGLLSLVS